MPIGLRSPWVNHSLRMFQEPAFLCGTFWSIFSFCKEVPCRRGGHPGGVDSKLHKMSPVQSSLPRPLGSGFAVTNSGLLKYRPNGPPDGVKTGDPCQSSLEHGGASSHLCSADHSCPWSSSCPAFRSHWCFKTQLEMSRSVPSFSSQTGIPWNCPWAM